MFVLVKVVSLIASGCHAAFGHLYPFTLPWSRSRFTGSIIVVLFSINITLCCRRGE